MNEENLERPLTEEELAKRFSSYDQFFKPENLSCLHLPIPSPSGLYTLQIEDYKTKETCWNYTCGVVRNKTGEALFSIKRNYSIFWHFFVLHPNGNEYLLCGQDYQGYTVANLTKRIIKTHLQASALKGAGFCWASVEPSPDGRLLAVNGCYWAWPYEIVFFDFSNPDVLPLPELYRLDMDANDAEYEEDHGGESAYKWLSNTTYRYLRLVRPLEETSRTQDGETYENYKYETAIWELDHARVTEES